MLDELGNTAGGCIFLLLWNRGKGILTLLKVDPLLDYLRKGISGVGGIISNGFNLVPPGLGPGMLDDAGSGGSLAFELCLE